MVALYTTLLGNVSNFISHICIVRWQHILSALFTDTWMWSNIPEIFDCVVWQCVSGQSNAEEKKNAYKTSSTRPVSSDLYFLLFQTNNSNLVKVLTMCMNERFYVVIRWVVYVYIYIYGLYDKYIFICVIALVLLWR